MRTFSKLVFICNICFILSAILRLVELNAPKANTNDALINLPPIVAAIVLLGLVLSIVLNIVYALLVAGKKLGKKPLAIPQLLLYFNLAMLPIQLCYYFITK